eukprot:10195750-Alexandrium_andersonii.AAC.1
MCIRDRALFTRAAARQPRAPQPPAAPATRPGSCGSAVLRPNAATGCAPARLAPGARFPARGHRGGLVHVCGPPTVPRSPGAAQAVQAVPRNG